MNLANKMLHRKSKTQHNTYDPDSVKQISKVDQAIHITLCKPAYVAVKNRKKITLIRHNGKKGTGFYELEMK